MSLVLTPQPNPGPNTPGCRWVHAHRYDLTGNWIGTDSVEVEIDEQDSINDRVQQVVAKARAILADPAGSPDWTAGERKVILAALIIRATR